MASYRVLHGIVPIAHAEGKPVNKDFVQGDVIEEEDITDLGLTKRELDRLIGHGAIEEIQEHKPRKSTKSKKVAKAEKVDESSSEIDDEDVEDVEDDEDVETEE